MLKFLEKFEEILAVVGGGICLILMTLMTVATVFGRYVVEADLIPGGYNVIEAVLMPLIVFWGLPMAYRNGSFPRLEFSFDRLGSKSLTVMRIVVITIEFAVYAVVLWYVAKFALLAFETGRQVQIGTKLWPAWPVYFMAPIAFVFMMTEMARRVVETCAQVNKSITR
jgi:TRAP-type C4-dicarboxylate transport system permease small subunit